MKKKRTLARQLIRGSYKLDLIISAIIPAFNEEERIVKTLLAVKKIDIISKIYVIDDGSKDNTAIEVSTLEDILLIKNPENRGKGKALSIGINAAIDSSDIIVLLDGDLEESAIEAIKLIKPILNNEADVTIAKFPPAKKKGGFGLVKKLAKYGVYMKTKVKLDTVLSGQRAFKKDVIKSINYNYEGFEIELAMTIDILNKGYIIKEVEVNMKHNETGRNIKDFLHRGKQFYHIAKTLINRNFINN